MKKPDKSKHSKIPYLYLLIATVVILIPLLLIWYGTPDNRLLKAVNRCDRDAAQRELDKGANVNVKSSEDDLVDNAPAVFIAARNGCPEIVELLLTHKADLNVQVPSRLYPGWTALMAAADKGHVQIVQILLKYGANVDIVIPTGDKKGWTALKIAESKGYTEIVHLLKETEAK